VGDWTLGGEGPPIDRVGSGHALLALLVGAGFRPGAVARSWAGTVEREPMRSAPKRTTRTTWRRQLIALAAATAFVLVAGACSSDGSSSSSPTTAGGEAVTSRPTDPPGAKSATSAGTKPVFVIYYLWWDKGHWASHLGSDYPLSQRPLPLPASLDKTGCSTVTKYPGNVETDVSQGLAYDQSNPQTILGDVELAASTGITGFAVNWIGAGTTTQTPTSSSYNERLASLIAAVHQVNAQGKPFKLMLNYQSSAKTLTMTQFTNDFNYFLARYGTDPALDHTYSTRPEVIMAGTWKYTDADLAMIARKFRSRMYLLGDEKPSSWNAARASSLDGTTYYWSSQNPYTNAGSFKRLQSFAATVRRTRNPDGTQKTWLAPFTPGYDPMLLYKTPTCVPRNDGRTMHVLFDGNRASNPDGWTLISWNEISEGSYVVPLTRYGNAYLNDLRTIVHTNR
jgi:hypothetical protein